MENLDIIVLSSIVSTLFVVFLGFTFKELSKPQEKSFASEESGPRANMIKYIGKLFDEPVITDEDANKRIYQYKAIQNLISDMESNGVYFPEEVKKELQKKREELKCEYSGLPSVKSYE